MREAEGPDGFADAVRRRALSRVLPLLGPRRAVVTRGGGGPPAEDGGPRPGIVVRTAGDAAPRASAFEVVGAADRIPVQSGAATGVLFIGVRVGEPEFLEAARLLQPGGTVVVIGHGTAADARALDAPLAAAGLERRLRIAILRTGVHAGRGAPAFAGLAAFLEMRRAAASPEGTDLEWVVAANGPGTSGLELPDTRGILASMFLPARWRGRRTPTARTPS